jgi:hypothetical protein
MADNAELKIVILWADELKLAATALELLRVLLDDGKTPDAQLDAAYKTALDACWNALHGVHGVNTAQIMLCHGDRLKFVPRDITIVRKSKT